MRCLSRISARHLAKRVWREVATIMKTGTSSLLSGPFILRFARLFGPLPASHRS